ncbi:MAG: hypothetical protein NT157_05935 [Candidatus Micrarchaeota archaeon]|nr:hypothetical protein [Candidatus Micrarchaeota archaeon]
MPKAVDGKVKGKKTGQSASAPQPGPKAGPAGRPEKKKGLSAWMKAGIVAIALFIVFVAYFVAQPVEEPKMAVWQEELSPNAELQLSEGSVYAYRYLSNGQIIANVTHTIMETEGGCTRVISDASGYVVSSCVDTGTGLLRQLQAGGAQVNATLDFVQPWMLSLREGWSWRAETNITLGAIGMGERTTVRYRVASVERVMGRGAFRVEIEAKSVFFASSGEAEPSVENQTLWVDSEKRVLLRAVQGDNEIELVSAPFALGE